MDSFTVCPSSILSPSLPNGRICKHSYLFISDKPTTHAQRRHYGIIESRLGLHALTSQETRYTTALIYEFRLWLAPRTTKFTIVTASTDSCTRSLTDTQRSCRYQCLKLINRPSHGFKFAITPWPEHGAAISHARIAKIPGLDEEKA